LLTKLGELGSRRRSVGVTGEERLVLVVHENGEVLGVVGARSPSEGDAGVLVEGLADDGVADDDGCC
jgi:hypothetical protein